LSPARDASLGDPVKGTADLAATTERMEQAVTNRSFDIDSIDYCYDAGIYGVNVASSTVISRQKR